MSSGDTCKATEKCVVENKYGREEGLKCHLGAEVNRLVTVDDFENIANRGVIYPIGETRVISFSSCPTQGYGGKVRLVFDVEKVKENIEPMCYLSNESKILDKMEEEIQITKQPFVTADAVRGNYNANLLIYSRECEYTSKEPISIGLLKRVEYWIGGSKPFDFSVDCERTYPHRAGVFSRAEDYKPDIMRTKRISEKLGVPFEVKSCFNSLEAGLDEAIELNEENLEKMKNGEIPKGRYYKEVEEKCSC